MYNSFRFLPANQAQTIRANQRDLFHVASLREQADTILQSWFGTRWLLRWDKELELCTKLAYFGLTTVNASQTLGEEYTDIWLQSARLRPITSRMTRLVLVVLSTLPPYLITRMAPLLSTRFPSSRLAAFVRQLPHALEILSEINLAVFYFYGTYYDLAKRSLRIRHISSTPQNPNVTPPSYSVLGLMLSIRLLYRFISSLRSFYSSHSSATARTAGKQPARQALSDEPTIDTRTVSAVLAVTSVEESDTIPAEEDEHSLVDVSSLGADERAGRRCTLCLEERTSTCATECGHLFCWSCVVGWGREKPECPLCRQSLNITRLLPIYNL